MKYITNLFGVGCVALLAMLFTASGAFAQVTYTYVDLDNGSGSTCSFAEPCLLDAGITAASGDTLLVKVRRSGGMVTLVPPTTALAVSVQFGTYARAGEDPVRGTLEFTGDFQIGGGGQFVLHSMATVQFEDVTITDAAGTVSVSSADNEKNSAQRLSITGTLTVPAGTTTVGALVVAEDLMIEGSAAGATLRVDELMVSNGATLTVGKAGNTVDLRVPLKKSAKDDPRGILTVSGTIDGTGAVWIAHDNTATSTGRGGPGDTDADPEVPADDFFHMSSDYMPDGDNKIDQKDCVRVTGGGEIENEIRAVAAGNICIELGNIGDITVAGSIESPAAGDATTDIIFRNNVEVDGDVVQWNDARVVFEGNATVTGSVILEDGALPTELATFGGARLDAGVATSVRRGVKLASAAEDDAFTCDYISTMDKVRVVDTPVVSLMVDNATIDEGGTATVTATLNKDHPDATAYPITIPVTFGGTATAGTGATDDYTAPAPATITISSGMTGTLAAISPSSTDGPETDAETIIVSLALGELPPTVRAEATASSVTITINPSTTGNVFVDDGASDMRFFKTQNTATAGPGFYIPGVQFQGVAMIEEDLHVKSRVITNVNSATNRADTRCAPRVIFGASPAGRANSAMMSHIQQDLVIEAQLMEIVDVGGRPTLMPTQRILLDADTGTNVTSAHNLSLDGDVFAVGDPIEMESAAVAMDEGMCVNTLSLNAGTRLVLSDDDGHVIVGVLTLDALVTQEDLKVDGSLTVSTLHVADGAELESDLGGLVTVSAGLILEGELDGALDPASGLTTLVYGTRRTDLVNVSNLTSLSVYIDDGEFRLDRMTTVEKFGLCKGNVVLFEAGEADDHTLTVTEFLTAKDGTLSLDTNDPGSIGSDVSKEAAATDGYILKYVTEGERTASTEWSSHTRKVAVDHKDAVIIVNEAKSLVEGVHLFNGHLHLKGDGSHLTVGMPSVSGVSPLIMVDNAELHANGNNVMVHGAVGVAIGDKEAGKIVTGGGELQVLGTASSMDLNNATAVITVGKAGDDGGSGTIDVGAGALQLGPEATNPKDGLHGDWQYPIAADARPHVKLEVVKGSVMGTVRVPKGSKQTEVIGASFGTIVFDGAATPNKGTVNAVNAANWDGTLYVVGPGDADKKLSVTVDSLNASNGAVEFRGTSATVNKDVAVSSSAIYQELKTLAFKGDLAISGDGGFSSRGGDAANRNSVSIGGDYSQVTTQTGKISENEPKGGAHLSAHTDKTVTGAFMTSGIGHATRYSTQSGTKLTLKGDFNFGLSAENYMLNADLEFSGKESQTVSAEVDLGSVEVNNSNGIVLADSVMQGSESTLTLTRGVISTMSESTWLVKNAGIEEDVRGRNNAVMTCESGESCESVIKGGSRRAHASAAVSRHVMHGNSGEGELSGGYLFPVGGMSGDRAHYRPLVLQLEDDLSEAMPATVTPAMASGEPSWPADNIVVPIQGGLLTLDVHANIFWKVELKEVIDQNPHIRIAASGLVNVFDDSRLRMVQWDCDWSNPRLAGTQIVGTDEDSFAENGYVNGVLNLTQESVDVGTCTILGVAANGLENPIHRDEITGGLAEVQFIHNAVIPVPVDVSLDDAPLLSGLDFQSATGYLMVSAGSHEARFQPLGVPAEQGINVELPTLQADKSYAVIAHGTLANSEVKTIETRKMSSISNMVEAILVHGSGDAPSVNVNLLDPYNSNQLDRLLTRQLAFDQTTKYLQLDPDFVNLQVTGADNMEIAVFQLDLSGRQGEALILNLSNVAAALDVYGVDVNGDRVSSYLATNIADAEELPTEFALHGNYPNPFNPSTRIQFDLPEMAQVSLQIVDMLGREVMTLPAKEFEAGANRSIELNAVNLASGTYLYRMIATGVESRYVKTGRMTLVK